VYQKELLQKEWYIQADVTGLFAQIISLVHHNRSVSSMLDNRELVAKRIKKQIERMAKDGNTISSAHGQAPTHQRPVVKSERDDPEDEPLPHGAA
jgi:4-hydroxy-3-methylbut-2-enyl diphosphate reductase IspH